MRTAANPLARFIAAYRGDLYTLRMAVTRLALSEHYHLALRDLADTWKPRNQFEQELKAIALGRSYTPLSVPRNTTPVAGVCKKLEAMLGVRTQETLNRQTLLERGGMDSFFDPPEIVDP
jgi:hypothetical protein